MLQSFNVAPKSVSFMPVHLWFPVDDQRITSEVIEVRWFIWTIEFHCEHLDRFQNAQILLMQDLEFSDADDSPVHFQRCSLNTHPDTLDAWFCFVVLLLFFCH